MIDQGFSTGIFPAFRGAVRARWAPVLLEPIAGSYERFVIGVAVVSESGFHLEMANALDRLKCLYSDDAAGAIYAVQLTTELLNDDLARLGVEALTNPHPAISGVFIGECREAEGESLAAIGASWMRSLSSLYRPPSLGLPGVVVDISEAMDSRGDGGGDRLPRLVFDYVSRQRNGFAHFFNADLRGQQKRRLTGRSHEVLIDFAGSRLVANFGTLHPGNIVKSVNAIKWRLWDLKVDRDRESTLGGRQHEMILQRPAVNDPQISARQYTNIETALGALEQQADQENLRLRSMSTVAEIGEHILQTEAA